MTRDRYFTGRLDSEIAHWRFWGNTDGKEIREDWGFPAMYMTRNLRRIKRLRKKFRARLAPRTNITLPHRVIEL